MTTQFSPAAKLFAPWSMSKAEHAKNCSFAFNLKHVKRMKGVTPQVSAAARIGKAAHEVLEGILKDKSDNPLKNVKPLLRRAAVAQRLTTPEIEEVMALTHAMGSFHQRMKAFCEKKGVTQTLVEHRFGLRTDFGATTFWGKALPDNVANSDSDSDTNSDTNSGGRVAKDVFFRGVWDLLLMASGYAVIIDHKSGVPPKEENDIKSHYAHQLNLYAVAALCLFPEIKGVHSALHFLQSEEIIWGDMVDAAHVREKLIPWYVQYINEAASCVLTNTPKIGWYCQFCEYTTVCPLKK